MFKFLIFPCYRWFRCTSGGSEEEREPLIDPELERLRQVASALEAEIIELEPRLEALRSDYIVLPDGPFKQEVFSQLSKQDYHLYLMKEKLAELRTAISLREC